MRTMTAQPATTPIPVQLSEPEFTAFILPHLSMPKRGPRCKLGYHRVFNLIMWVLYHEPDTAAHAGGGKGRCLRLYFLLSRWCCGTGGVGADVGGHVAGSLGDVPWSMRHCHTSASRTPGRP